MKPGDFVEVKVPQDFKEFERDNGVGKKEKHEILKTQRAAKLVDQGEVFSTISVVVKENGQRVIKLFTVLNEYLPEIIKAGSEFWEDIKALFSVLPERIEKGGHDYSLTLQPANGKELDKVIYLVLEEEVDPIAAYILFQQEAPTMYQAKRLMYDQLKAFNYI